MKIHISLFSVGGFFGLINTYIINKIYPENNDIYFYLLLLLTIILWLGLELKKVKNRVNVLEKWQEGLENERKKNTYEVIELGDNQTPRITDKPPTNLS